MLCNLTQTFYPQGPGKCGLPGSTTAGGAALICPLKRTLWGCLSLFCVNLLGGEGGKERANSTDCRKALQSKYLPLKRTPHSVLPCMLALKVEKKHLQQMETIIESHN